MRLFVALAVPAEPAAALAAALGREPDPRWHLTLAFLGEQAAAQPVAAALARVAFAPFRLSLAGAGTFSGGRVLWVGVGEGEAPLRALAADVSAACRGAGVALEDRPFRPHVTVRRGRGLRPGALTEHAGPAWTVGAFALLESRLLGASGVRYLPVAEVTAATTAG